MNFNLIHNKRLRIRKFNKNRCTNNFFINDSFKDNLNGYIIEQFNF